jgi:hypothetical protein
VHERIHESREMQEPEFRPVVPLTKRLTFHPGISTMEQGHRS